MSNHLKHKDMDAEAFEMFVKSVTERLNRQEEMIKILVDDLRQRNKEGKLYIRGERMYDSQELQTLLLMGERTLQRYRTTGELPYFKLHRTCYHRESDVVRLINEHGKYFNKKGKSQFLAQLNNNIINN